MLQTCIYLIFSDKYPASIKNKNLLVTDLTNIWSVKKLLMEVESRIVVTGGWGKVKGECTKIIKATKILLDIRKWFLYSIAQYTNCN